MDGPPCRRFFSRFFWVDPFRMTLEHRSSGMVDLRWSAARSSSECSFLACVLAALSLVQCADDPVPQYRGGDGAPRNPPAVADNCAVPSTGCPCTQDGKEVDCGVEVRRDGDNVSCAIGRRTCEDATWSACQTTGPTTVKYAPLGTLPGVRTLALAPTAVSCMEPCNPYCNVYGDTPTGVNAGPDLTVASTGISLLEPASGTGSCTNIVILPSSPVVTVTALDDVATTPAYEFASTPSTITFTATCGAGGPQIFPSWVLANYDSATIDQNGVFRVYSGVAQNIDVQALTSLGSQTKAVQVKIAIATVDPACTSTALFSAAATGGADPATILYPYSIPTRPVTFPLSLSAPLVQWSTGGTNAGCVKISLRYPVGGPYTFSWSRIVNGEPKQGVLDTAQPALNLALLDQTVWNVFDRTAAGSVGEVVLQRKQALAAAVMTEKVARVGFATDALRGTVYYTQYFRHFRDAANTATDLCTASGQPDLNFATYPAVSIATGQRTAAPVCPAGSCVGDSISGATTVQALRVGTPGAVAVNAFGAQPGCPVCHSVSADGRVFVSGSRFWQQVASPGTTNGINTIGSNTLLTPVADAPAYSSSYNVNTALSKWDLEPWLYLNSPPVAGVGSPPEDARGFAYAAISPEGHYVLQGPNFWGSGRNDIVVNNTQDGVDPAGGKRYVLLDREKLRPEVQVATAAALTLSSATTSTLTGTASTLTIDGYAVVVGNSALVNNQVTASQNGIYTRIANDGSARFRLLRRTDADAVGELSFGQKFEVRNGTDHAGKYFIVATPTSGTITPGTTALGFALYTTVRVATTAALPNTPVYSTAAPAAHTLTSSAFVAFPTVDGVAATVGLGILVKDQVTTGQNGIYTLTTLGSGTVKWVQTRRGDANLAGDFNPGLRVRATEGTTNGGRVYGLAAAVATLGTTGQTYTEDTTLLNEGRTYAGNTALPNMMVPVFSPNGAKLAYVNADADPIAAVSTGWRRGLSVMDFNAATARFSNKQRLINTWNAGTAGVTLKWPFFESDSQSLVYVESEAAEHCIYAPAGNVVDTDLERACNDNLYGDMGPTLRGYWKGSIKAVNINSPATTVQELSYLNDTVPFASSQDRAYQPTVLPSAVGGKRWVIFTSPRSYGNQLNQGGTHFSCGTPLLWMAAIDDSPAATSDRSYPAFLLPGQLLRAITDTVNSSHYLNERGYLVPSPCTPVGTTCTVDEECCGGSGGTPTTACRIDLPVSSPPTRHCATLPALCGAAGATCATAADCCEVGALCVAGGCSVVPPPGNYSAGEFARTFNATCPNGYHVVWGNFEWRATVPTTSTITFTGQSAANAAGLASAAVVALTQATSSNSNPPPAAANAFNVGAALRLAGVPSFGSVATLSVTIHLQPSVDLSAGPTLHNWAQRYECQVME